ncbi:membrane-spanning 4-domains subfamily A member 13 [Dromiciops gliroides]|uniref:membrane-spanning 4-domains subfamily A member 13 n=1 Tax=Dromiciops gliroides TaxID=33562 RepID=UPI001CC5DE29|nr:membrane-spanning 4-domains subfamily A member 13 [Dromiciops gliroides]
MPHFPVENLSLLDSLVLGAVQIMTSSFHLLMWYFLFDLYSKQHKGYFGIYNPITYRVHYPSWAISFLMSGILSVNEAKYSSIQSRKLALFGNLVSATVASIGIILIITELCSEAEMSYKNFARANVGRMVSMILLITSLLEFGLTFTYIYYILCNWDSLMEESTVENGTDDDVEGQNYVEEWCPGSSQAQRVTFLQVTNLVPSQGSGESRQKRAAPKGRDRVTPTSSVRAMGQGGSQSSWTRLGVYTISPVLLQLVRLPLIPRSPVSLVPEQPTHGFSHGSKPSSAGLPAR